MSERKKMLVADDEEALHTLYREIFEGEFNVIGARDGADALMLAVEHLPEVMILDIAMPLLDGRSLCRKLKKHHLTRDIKILMVTGKTSQLDRRLGFEIGVDDYIEKPVCPDFLARAVRKLTGGRAVAPRVPECGAERGVS